MANKGLKATLAGLLALGASGCMSMGGYGGYGSGYGNGYGGGYYDDGYGRDYAYNDRCYDAYGGYYDYYSQYDCYDRNDYNSRFSINIGFGGGWWNDFYYPGSGYYMYDRYGVRRQLYGNYARYWGGRRAGYRWQRNGGHHDGRRGRAENRDRSGVGGQIIDRVDRANNRPDTDTRRPRAAAPQLIDRGSREVRSPRDPGRIVERIERVTDRPVAAPQPRAAERPIRVERASPAAAAAADRTPRERRSAASQKRSDRIPAREDE